jgi:hypothetical protein
LIFEHQMASLALEAAVYKRAGCIPFHHLKLGRARAGLIPSTFIKSLKCRTVHHPVSSDTGMLKNADAGPVRYWNKRTQSGIGMSRNEMLNAGMPMPAASVSIHVPSCMENRRENNQFF